MTNALIFKLSPWPGTPYISPGLAGFAFMRPDQKAVLEFVWVSLIKGSCFVSKDNF